jgi:hypothetical protein
MRTLLLTSLLVLASTPTGDASAQVIEADHLTTTESGGLKRARIGGIRARHGHAWLRKQSRMITKRG